MKRKVLTTMCTFSNKNAYPQKKGKILLYFFFAFLSNKMNLQLQCELGIHIFFLFEIKARKKSISKPFKVSNGGKMGYIW